MKTAIVTGVSGQDGSLLAELLLSKGYRVVGTVRNVASSMNQLPPEIANSVEVVSCDMRDQQIMEGILSQYRPCEFYNFAAHTSGAGMFEDPVSIGEINGLSVARILEAIRKVDSNIRFCQASSREVFGEAVQSPQTEATVRSPRSPYGAAKLYADSLVEIYRRHFGIFACSAILFNHESPRRPINFVTRKITSGAVKIKLGIARELHLGNLETLRDWGFAGDYVYGMWLMLQQRYPDDYVLATGKVHSVREFCELAFAHLGLDYRKYIKSDTGSYRPSEPVVLVGDAKKAKQVLNWEPKISFCEMIAMMVEADLKINEKKGVI